MALPQSIRDMNNLFLDVKINGENMQDLWTSWQLTTEFKESIRDFSVYLVEEGDNWHNISERIYGTRDFWWVLALFNEVEDPFTIFLDNNIPIATNKIKTISREDVGFLLSAIRNERIEREIDKRSGRS